MNLPELIKMADLRPSDVNKMSMGDISVAHAANWIRGECRSKAVDYMLRRMCLDKMAGEIEADHSSVTKSMILSGSFDMGPLRPGVYFLIRKKEIVYVGQAKVPGARINQHKKNKVFERAFVLSVPMSSLNTVESYFISKMKPILNVVGNPLYKGVNPGIVRRVVVQDFNCGGFSKRVFLKRLNNIISEADLFSRQSLDINVYYPELYLVDGAYNFEPGTAVLVNGELVYNFDGKYYSGGRESEMTGTELFRVNGRYFSCVRRNRATPIDCTDKIKEYHDV